MAGLGRLQVTNLISVSTHGKVAVDALAGESARLLNGVPADEHPLAASWPLTFCRSWQIAKAA
ncbi:hypothetical protein WDV93_00990 [Pantoea ananatis]